MVLFSKNLPGYFWLLAISIPWKPSSKPQFSNLVIQSISFVVQYQGHPTEIIHRYIYVLLLQWPQWLPPRSARVNFWSKSFMNWLGWPVVCPYEVEICNLAKVLPITHHFVGKDTLGAQTSTTNQSWQMGHQALLPSEGSAKFVMQFPALEHQSHSL